MKLFLISKKSLKPVKNVTAYDVALNSVLFFYGLQYRFGMDAELVHLSKEAVEVCSAICNRLKEIEK